MNLIRSRTAANRPVRTFRSAFLLLVLGLIVWPSPGNPEEHKNPTTVYIVRHAEKADGQSEDPPLSPDGRERARLLRDMLRDVPIAAVYATKYQRTQLTVAPAAEARNVPVEVRDAKDMAALAREILDKHRGDNVLVAGHLGSVTALLKELGVSPGVELQDSEWDNLFIVEVDGAGRARLIRLHYGY